MSFELFVALRYLTSRRKQTFIFIISLVSVLGVAIGVAALVVVMGVYNGFTTDIRNQILGSNPHLLLMSSDPLAFDPPAGARLLEQVQAMSGVKSATSYIYTEVLLSSPRGATGLVLRGVDPVQAVEALPLLRHLEAGKVENLLDSADGEGSVLPGILLGKELASRFSLTVGSRVNLMSPAGQRTTAGFAPKIRTFRVQGIFKAGMSDYDNRLGYISLVAAQDLLGLPTGRISGIEIFLDDPYAAREEGKVVEEALGSPFYARNWMDLNSGLFAALQLERIGMFIVLAMVVLVGSFSIITSLVMLVMEKTRDIAVLMSMGATSRVIRRIFMLQGTVIGVVGTGLGYILGLSLAWVLKHYQFIKLPPGIYPLDRLPVMINPVDTAFIGVVSILLCFLATVYPARQAARLMPAEALRYE